MTDIVERLQHLASYGGDDEDHSAIQFEAADEIERLRDRLDNAYEQGIIDGRKEERERCIAAVMERAAKWADHARHANHSDCSDSLAEECEDIAVAIRGLGNDRHR